VTSRQIDFEAARSNPSGHFETPEEVVRMSTLTEQQKIEILRQWETDVRLMAVAEEENMPGDEPVPLDRVLKAIEALTGPAGPAGAGGGVSSSKLGR
jgi:hypothetical protein